MYIEYITPQRVADPNYTKYDTEGGNFRPTWLIRTSDWQKVPGIEAIYGYHTLSYVWEQSGENFQRADGEFDLIDNGSHRVTTAVEKRGASDLIQKHETRKVKYEGVLQQICKDFDIKYLWYDKVCIDQTNKAEKHREIKQMHLIYSNARYTVALVPEINIEDPKDFDRIYWNKRYTEAKAEAISQMWTSLWFQRSWTLEEVMVSTRILVVGRNTHFWSLANFRKDDKPKESDTLANIMLGFRERKTKSANQVLQFAHFRKSTNELDKIFAMANILHGIIDIDMDYDSDVTTAMNTFYRHLAERDLSVICFGSNLYPNGNPMLATTMDSYQLPSWTGVAGLHSTHPIASITLDQSCDFTIGKYMQLLIKCRYYTIRPTKYNDNDFYSNGTRKKRAEDSYSKVINSMDDFECDESVALDWSQWCIYRATVCYATHYYKPDDHLLFLSPLLPLSLTEECDECVILGVVFDSLVPKQAIFNNVSAGYSHNYLSPIARKSTEDSSYRIIGVILLKHFQDDGPRDSPQDVMDKMFNKLGCETQELSIK